VEYLGLRARGGRAEAVLTSHGEIHPGAVVLATGVAPAELLPVEQLRFKGHLVATEPAPATLSVGLNAAGIAIAQLDDGRLLAGGDLVPDDGSPEIDEAVVGRHHAGLGRLLPERAGLRLSHAWCCSRPGTADRVPVVDRAPGLDNVWLTAGHYTTGLLLAPVTGHAIASWIASGTAPTAMAQFRIDRRGAGLD
jgi:glycine/D-amino acid oxidase-like deaminating enzyme